MTCYMFTILSPICFLMFIFPFLPYVNWNSYLICNRAQFLCNFHFHYEVIATDAMPTHWAFYFEGSGLPLLVSGSWSGSMCWAHIALQELQAIAMMLCKMAFCLSGKVVALHLDNSTAKAYQCNQDGTVSHFLSRLACWIMSLTDKHGITLIPAYILTHLNVEANYLSPNQMPPEWHLLPQVAQAAFHLWGLPEVDLLEPSHSTQCQYYYTLKSLLPLGALVLNAFNHPWMFHVSYMFSPALVPLVLSKFLVEYVKGQCRHLNLVAPCWMEAFWLPTVLNMFTDIPWWCPIIKDLVVDVSAGQVLKGQPYLHLTLWLLSNVCCADRGSLPQSVRWWQEQPKCLCQRTTSSVGKKWAGWCAQQGEPNNAISAPKLANFLVHLFQVGLAWHTIGIYHSAISTFLESHHLHKASNHPAISKLMCHFYIQCPTWKHFDPWDVEYLLSLLESWAPASSLTAFKHAWKITTLLAHVTVKCCSDLTLLCIGTQYLFLQHHAAVFIPMCDGKADCLGHLPPQICIDCHTSINLCPVFEGLFEMY